MLVNSVRVTPNGVQSAEVHSDAGHVSSVSNGGNLQIVIENVDGLPEGERRFLTLDLTASDRARLKALL